MSSLGDSLKVKRAGEKAPSVVGMPPVATPDKAITDYGTTGKGSGGLKKHAGTTPKNIGEGDLSDAFAKSIGIKNTDGDKQIGYF